ncbi:MAG: cytochrome P450 [Persicimonas sp.]
MMLDRTQSPKSPPGPTGLEVASWLSHARRDTFGAFASLAREYGDVARCPLLPGHALYLCSSPEAAKHVLQDNHRGYKKAVTYDYLEPVVGKGLLTSHGDLWLRQRRLVAPMFHRKRVRTYLETMAESTAQMLDDWAQLDDDDTIDVAEQMSQLTLSVAGKILFNRDIGRDSDWIGESMLLLFRDINQRILSLFSLPRAIPTPHNRRVQKALDDLEDLVYGMIEERRGRADQFDDLLSTFMLAEDEETGERMSDEEIRDEIMTFMIAGHDTTSNLLAWALYLLSKHPGTRARLESEIDDVLEARVPDIDEVRSLDFLEQVVDETLRLYPPAWTIEREPIEDDVIAGYHIPAGSIVAVGPYFVHHNPRVWENPEGFDPDRFGPDAERPDHRYAHFPFGGGPRMCVGADFAILEAKIILAAITRNFRLDLVPFQKVEPEATVTLYPKDGIEMTLRPRRS